MSMNAIELFQRGAPGAPYLSSSPPFVATVACDVSAYKLNLICRELSAPGAVAEWEILNRTEPITSTLL